MITMIIMIIRISATIISHDYPDHNGYYDNNEYPDHNVNDYPDHNDYHEWDVKEKVGRIAGVPKML